jgi:glycerol-3-phosphate acyltransferase PlsX
MKIGIDIMGGDYAPKAPLKGIANMLPSLPEDVELVLLGDQAVMDQYKSLLDPEHHDQVSFIPTTQVIEMGESPTKAFNNKPEASMAVGLNHLASSQFDVLISAGNTGALMVGSLYTVKPITGIIRPPLTTLVPKPDGNFGIILDVGANPDCKPEVLNQFGILGTMYLNSVYNIQNPRVGLLNIGTEPEKGNVNAQNTYRYITDHSNNEINFAGNVEGYDLFRDKAEVYVCDGFTGNIVLKSAEGIFELIKKRGITDEYFKHFDFENHGGTPILGINKPVIVGHGVSTPTAFENMVKQGQKVVKSNLVNHIKKAFET